MCRIAPLPNPKQKTVPAAGGGRLGRAAARGPRAYARMALFPRDPGRDPGQGPAALRTPLQPPGFCPDFAARREVPLLLDAQCVRMLATQVRIAGFLLHEVIVYLMCSAALCVCACHIQGSACCSEIYVEWSNSLCCLHGHAEGFLFPNEGGMSPSTNMPMCRDAVEAVTSALCSSAKLVT